jgi:hypothetical protein
MLKNNLCLVNHVDFISIYLNLRFVNSLLFSINICIIDTFIRDTCWLPLGDSRLVVQSHAVLVMYEKVHSMANLLIIIYYL